MMSEATAEATAAPRTLGLNHFTLPVRDRYKAARFYAAVFGATVDHESDPERVKKGLARSLQVGVVLPGGIAIDLFEQDFGQPAPQQAHPHHALDIAPAAVPAWVEHLTRWGVPFVGPMTRSGTTACEIYLRDVDGNNIELHCDDYPEELRAKLTVGPFDMARTTHDRWPPPEREAEAEGRLQEEFARMRARKPPL